MSKTVRTPVVAFAATAEPSGDVVRRKGVIFRAGDYSTSHGFTMTPDELKRVASTFKDAIKLDHGHPSVDGPIDFGVLESVEASPDGTTLYGTTKTPKWLDGALGNARWLVSASFDRATKSLRRLSLVTRPRIPDAELQAAFACACGGHVEAEHMPYIQEVRPMAESDRKARALALVNEMDDDDLAVMLGDVPIPDEDDDFDDEGEEMPGEAPEEVPYLGDEVSAQFAERDARIAELEEKDRRREAEVFVDSAIKDALVLPAEREGMVADHIQSALDDMMAPAQFADGKRSTRVERFQARVRARRPHGFTREANFSGGGVPKGPETDQEYAKRVNAKYLARDRRNGPG